MAARADVTAREVLADLARSGAAAIVPGDRDLARGLAAYRALVEAAKVPVLAANLIDAASGAAPFPGHRVVQAGPVKVGLVGLVGEGQLAKVEGVRVDPLLPAAKREIEAVRKAGADLVILVTHADSSSLKKALAELPHVHVAIAGADRQLTARPARVGEAVLMGGGDRGRTVGHLRLHLDGPPWKLADAGAADAVQAELKALDQRIGYFRKLLDGQGAGADKRRELGQRRLPELEAERKAKQEALAKAAAAPVAGNRFRLVVAEMGADIQDHAETGRHIATYKQALAAAGGGGPATAASTGPDAPK